jgi:hypothetical protein
MSWLNVRALTSLLVLALLALPLVAPFAGLVVPASGQPQVFTITSYVATPEGLIGFYLNYSHARVAVGLTGLTLDFYVSADGTAAVSPGDVRVGRVTVTADTVDVFGTLKLPDNSTLYSLLGRVSGTLFVKVSDGSRVIVASTPFDLRASKLFKALNLSKTRLATHHNVEFGVSSDPKLTIDLTPYGLGAILGTFDYNITRLVSEEHVYRLIEYNGTRGTYESDVSWPPSPSSYGTNFTASFLLRADFPLNNPEKTVTFRGVTFNYEDFILEYFAGVFKNYTKAIKVDAGRQVNTVPRDFTNEVEVKIGLAWPSVRTVDIFPSVAVNPANINRDAAGVRGELNVGDTIRVDLANFPKNMWIFVEARVYGTTALSPILYTENLTATIGVVTNNVGRATFNFSVGAGQHGGRLITFTFYTQNYTLGPFRAPATNIGVTPQVIWREAVKPHVWIWSFDNAGGISTTRPIAPGSYVLVVGRGFIAEPLVFKLVRAVDGVEIADLTQRSMLGVLGNGSFAAIVQLPVETLPPDLDGTSVYVVARGTVTATNEGRTANIVPPGAASLTLRYDGGAAVVYINPTPRAANVVDFSRNRVVLGADVYPYAAVWEPEARRVIEVEAIGLNRAWAVRAVNVTLRSIGAVPGLPAPGIVSVTLALNEPVTFGYFKKTYPVPTLPHNYAGYHVRVSNGTNTFGSSEMRAYAVRINATIAIIDPADGVPRKTVRLVAPEDVNVIGYGWAARLDAYYNIQPIAFAAGIPLNTSESNGVLRGVLRLPLYITQPGSYRVVVYQQETRSAAVTLSSFADVLVGVLPAFTIKLVTSPTMFADLPLEVWVVAYFDGRIASVERGQIVSVVVEAFARGVGKTSVALSHEPLASSNAVYYGSLKLLDTLGSGVKGKNVLLVATAVGRYDPRAPLQEAYDVASVTVPPVTTVEMLEGISRAVSTEVDRLIRNLSDKLESTSTSISGALGTAVKTISGNISAVISYLGSLSKALEGNVSLIIGNVSDIKDLLGKVNRTVILVGDDVKANLSKRLDRINTTLIGISGNVTEIMKLVRLANLSISRVVVDEAGKVVAELVEELRNSERRIVGVIVANATALSDLIRAVGIDLADVKALLVEVNTNVGLVGQAVLVVGDDVRAVLSRLDSIDATLAGISGGVAKIITDVEGLAKLIREANLNISRVVVDEAGKVVAELRSSEDRIVGAVSTNAATLSDLIRTVETRVRGDVRGLSDALAAFQSEAFSRLDAVARDVDTVRSDLARLRTDAAAMAGVVAGIQATVSRVDTNVGNLAETVRTIATTVDSVNRAVPGLATKADVSGAQAAITGAVDRAKTDIESAVEDTRGAAAASSRNWGIINAILIIIAIAILAYTTFVARRP